MFHGICRAIGALAALGFPNGAESGGRSRNMSNMELVRILDLVRVAIFLRQRLSYSQLQNRRTFAAIRKLQYPANRDR
jgi:hypothetical protein